MAVRMFAIFLSFKGQGRCSPKPVLAGLLSAWIIFHSFSRHISRESDQKWSRWDSNQHYRQQFYLLPQSNTDTVIPPFSLFHLKGPFRWHWAQWVTQDGSIHNLGNLNSFPPGAMPTPAANSVSPMVMEAVGFPGAARDPECDLTVTQQEPLTWPPATTRLRPRERITKSKPRSDALPLALGPEVKMLLGLPHHMRERLLYFGAMRALLQGPCHPHGRPRAAQGSWHPSGRVWLSKWKTFST